MKYVDPKQYDFSRLNEKQLQVAVKDDSIFDSKFETKPIGYFKDAWIRFTKNKGSVVAGIILLLLVAFAVFGPLASPWATNQENEYYQLLLPKVREASNGFWDGTKMKTEPEKTYIADKARGAVVGEAKYDHTDKETGIKYYTYRFDTYVRGYTFEDFSEEEYQEILNYQSTTGIQIFYPILDTSYNISPITGMPISQGIEIQHQNANNYYQLDKKFNPILDENGEIIPIYMKDSNGDYVYYEFNGTNYETRVNYDAYYVMVNGKAPMFYFGSDNMGRDIFTRLCHGARLSLILGFSVSFINIILGIIYGAIEGYYGGKTDLIMERVSDILSEIPSLVLLTLFQIYFASTWGPVAALLVAFVLTGWIGTASRVRMQFYRFKNQEYVLAARVLGAKDRRIVFRHILPNAVGTLITASILMIPGVIFTESSLSFLNIIDLETGSMTSIGTMLSAGQDVLATHPHVILFPAIFISVLMITFNLFGNGLRDAFNPSLRGVEE